MGFEFLTAVVLWYFGIWRLTLWLMNIKISKEIATSILEVEDSANRLL